MVLRRGPVMKSDMSRKGDLLQDLWRESVKGGTGLLSRRSGPDSVDCTPPPPVHHSMASSRPGAQRWKRVVRDAYELKKDTLESRLKRTWGVQHNYHLKVREPPRQGAIFDVSADNSCLVL
jgi:hypothetical protein